MARIWNERFEGSGYEESWSIGETITGGNTVDEDQLTSGVTGAPGNWGNQCLKIETTAGAGSDAYVLHTSIGGTIQYHRFEVIIEAESLANGQSEHVYINLDATNVGGMTTFLYQAGGNLHFLHGVYRTSAGGWQYYVSFPVLSLDTRYRVETYWNDTDNEWAWRIDGVNQSNDIDLTDPVTSVGSIGTGNLRPNRIFAGTFTAVTGTTTYYLDNIAVDDADWVGGGPGTILRPPLRPFLHNLGR